MTQVAANPLPVGRYWIFQAPRDQLGFEWWLAFTHDNGWTETEHTSEKDPEDGWRLYVFRVVEPVYWYEKSWSWPERADAATMEIWKPGAAPRAKRAKRWALTETIIVGIGTIVVASLLLRKFGGNEGATAA